MNAALLAVAAALGLAGVASAQDPAVAIINLKVTAAAGTADSADAWVGVAGLTAPIGSEWGLQAEAGIAGVDGDTVTGFAGHLFTRDPASHLIGAFVSYASDDDFGLDATRAGVEAEIYLSQLTVLLKGGYQFSDTVGDTAFGEVEVHFYASDNFRLAAGVSIDEQSTLGHVGAEWQMGFSSLPGLALRADAYIGENDFDSATAGITYYFGTDASLKDRHRKQDPDSALLMLFKRVEHQRAQGCTADGLPLVGALGLDPMGWGQFNINCGPPPQQQCSFSQSGNMTLNPGAGAVLDPLCNRSG
jgi:hypothetical protein